MTPEPITTSTFLQFEKRLEERHAVQKESIDGIRGNLREIKECVGDLSKSVKLLRTVVERENWGPNPYPAPGDEDPQPGDTKDIVRVVRGFGALIVIAKKHSAAIAVILSALGIWGVNAATDTGTTVTQEELQETVRTAAVEAVKEVLKPSP
jgi:hypothetical protein